MCISVKQRHRLTVLILQVGEFNPAFEQFLKFLNGIKYKGEPKDGSISSFFLD